jgi:hypothetical protein
MTCLLADAHDSPQLCDLHLQKVLPNKAGLFMGDESSAGSAEIKKSQLRQRRATRNF